MTTRELTRAQLPKLASWLLVDANTVVLLIPATEDAGWAASAAWDFARAAVSGARRVVLVDLSVEDPMLDRGARTSGPEGIVDAFIYGASLSYVAQEQEVPGLHYIGAGTHPTDPTEVWNSPRWPRLSRGFASEGALLILFAPPAALSELTVAPDGLVVLAPNGYDASQGQYPEIADKIARGTPLLSIVVDQPRSDEPVSILGESFRRSRRITFGRINTSTAIVASALLVGTGLTAVALLRQPDDPVPADTVPSVATLEPTADIPPATQPTPPPPPPPPPQSAREPDPGDSLFYSVQVAAFNTLPRAMSYVSELEEEQWVALASPVRLGNQSIWYRVFVGTLPNSTAADSTLRAMWRSRLLDRPQGTILRTPNAYLIGEGMSVDAARDRAEGLRASGIPAYIVTVPGGEARIYLGAFEGPNQARAADSLLASASITATLVPRMGIAR